MMNIYDEFDSNKQIPIIVGDYCDDMILIEVRAYSTDGSQRGAIWQTMTFDQAKILCDNLTAWIYQKEHDKREKQ